MLFITGSPSHVRLGRAHMHAARHCDGVCVLYGTCEKEHRMCIVMKRYEHSLADAIAGRSLDVASARRYGHSLFRTLRQLHESGLVVQDIIATNLVAKLPPGRICAT